MDAIRFASMAFSSGASITVVFDRNDKDQYSLSIETASSYQGVAPSRNDIYEIIPSTSDVAMLLGWHSYFGCPFPAKDPKWLAVGVEAIKPHETRDAYLVLNAYLYSLPLPKAFFDGLLKLSELVKDNRQRPIKVNDYNGLIRATSVDAEQHRSIEDWILRRSKDEYQEGLPFVFRTLVLLEGQLGIGKPYYLRATVPAIEKSFSQLAKWKIRSQQVNKTAV